MCDWKACTTATNGLPNPNERMPRTGMSWVPRSLYICPTRLPVFLLGRKDLRALGALRIDDNQAFTTANRALFGADEIWASHRHHWQYPHPHRRALLLQSWEQTLRNGKDSRVLQVGDSLLHNLLLADLENRVRSFRGSCRFPLDRENGSPGKTRTCNPSVNSRMLYH